MATPITFSGFNDIDFTQILNAVMAQESLPVSRLQTQQTTLTAQKSAYTALATRLGTLQSAIDALGTTDSLAILKATSSDSGVGVATTTGSVAGTYNVVVSELARAQTLASTSTYAGVDSVVALGGGLTIIPATGAPITVTLTGSTTLAGLAAAINAKTNSTVSASVVQATPGHYKLALTGKSTGADNAFTVTSTLAGGAGVTFADTDGSHIYGDNVGDNAQDARDAVATVNGLSITSSSNTLTDVIPGVTLTLRKKDAATTAVVDVSRDGAAGKALLGAFIKAYNSVTDFQRDQTSAAVAGKASIGRDPLLRGLMNSVHSRLQGQYASGNSFKQLAAVGLGFARDGHLTLDESTFDQAIASAPGDVQTLFSGVDGKGGAFGAHAKSLISPDADQNLHSLVADYTAAGGLVDSQNTRLDAQMLSMTRRIDSMQGRLDVRRATLSKEYAAADAAMTQLKSQGDGLSQLNGQYRLF